MKKLWKGLAMVLMFVTAFVAGVTTNKLIGAKEAAPMDAVQNTTDSLVIEQTSGNGIKMMATKIEAGEYTQLTGEATYPTGGALRVDATVAPTTIALTWSAVWNGEPPTNTAKAEDYITVTTVDELGHSVCVAVKSAFSTQIALTATTVDKYARTASCTVDYLKRATNAGLNIIYRTDNDNPTMEIEAGQDVICDIDAFHAYYGNNVVVETGVGSKDDTYTHEVELVFYGAFVDAVLDSFGNGVLNENIDDTTVDNQEASFIVLADCKYAPNLALNVLSESIASEIAAGDVQYMNYLKEAIAAVDGEIGFISIKSIGTKKMYDGSTQSQHVNLPVCYLVSSLTLQSQSLSLSDTSLTV